MEPSQMNAVWLEQYGEAPMYGKQPKPVPQEGEVLIKVEASTINPSDNLFIRGQYFRKPLPTIAGFQGVGRVEEARGQALQYAVGKRVSFTARSGSWAAYSTASQFFVIEEDVPVASAASGIVNPATVLGFIHTVKQKKHTGIIHTSAASSLGRMLVKICKTQNIPLLNIVRRKQQAELLHQQGAEHVLVTEGDWQQSYKELVRRLKVNALFNSLGGGEVSEKLIEGLETPASVYFYGTLSGQLTVSLQIPPFFQGLNVTGFHLSAWLNSITADEKKEIAQNYSKYLKGDLATTTFKEYNIKDIKEPWSSAIRAPLRERFCFARDQDEQRRKPLNAWRLTRPAIIIKIMSLTLAEIAELRADLENDVRDLDGQIEYLETMYLEETKEAGNIIKGFQNYVNVRLNPRGSNMYQKRSKLQARQRIFSLSSCRSPANNQLDQLTEVRVDNGVNGTASHTLKRQKRKKNYAQLDQGYKEYSDRNEGDSMNNSQNNYEDYESKSKKKR